VRWRGGGVVWVRGGAGGGVFYFFVLVLWGGGTPPRCYSEGGGCGGDRHVRTGDAARTSGQPVPAWCDTIGQRHELRRDLQRRRCDDPVPVRRRRRRDPDTAGGIRRGGLAWVQTWDRARAGIRLPCSR